MIKLLKRIFGKKIKFSSKEPLGKMRDYSPDVYIEAMKKKSIAISGTDWSSHIYFPFDCPDCKTLVHIRVPRSGMLIHACPVCGYEEGEPNGQ